MDTIFIVFFVIVFLFCGLMSIYTKNLREKMERDGHLDPPYDSNKEKKEVGKTVELNLILKESDPDFTPQFRTTIKSGVIHEGDMDYVVNIKDDDFCALAIHTLDIFSASACRIGVVKVKDGIIQKEAQFDFAPIKLTKKISKVLGEETVNEVMSYPLFSDVWVDLKTFFDSQVAVTYDMGNEPRVLSYFLEHYNIDFKPISFRFALSKTQNRLNKLKESMGLDFTSEDCLLLAKLVANIELGSMERDDLKMLKSYMNRKL